MTKSIDDYEADIKKFHSKLQGLPPQHPDYETIEDKLSRQRTAWAKKLDITVQVAKNEKTPWQSDELGYPCIPMSLKKDSMMRQTGDYVAYLGDYDMFGGLCIERKTLQDLYGTLMNRDQRSRLYREIARYEADPRFNRFHLIAECTYEEFLKYVPEVFVYTQDSAPDTLKRNIKQYLKRFYKIDVSTEQINPDCGGLEIFVKSDKNVIYITGIPGGAEVFIDGILRETLTMKRNQYGKTQYFVRRGASETSKIETINSLENRIQVSFVGSRARAVEKYGGLVRQWCRVHYKEILTL